MKKDIRNNGQSKTVRWSATFEPFTVDPMDARKKALLKSKGCDVTKDGKTIGIVTGAREKDDEVVVDVMITSKTAAEDLIKDFKFTINSTISNQDK